MIESGAEAVERPGSRERRGAGRAALLSLFLGGVLCGAGLILTGSWFVARTPAASVAAQVAPEPLVTLPPVVAPISVTPTEQVDGYALGDPKAPVTVDVWADYQCPYCRLFTLTVEQQLVATYVSTHRARLVFHDLAFLGEESRWAAVAARLAKEQGKFWPYHDYLFANQQGENSGAFSLERLREMASAVGLDLVRYDAGIKIEAARRAFADISARSQAEASALAVTATPTIFVSGARVAKPDWATVQAAIENALAA